MLKRVLTILLILLLTSPLYSAISKVQNALATTVGASPRVRAWGVGPTEGNLLIAIGFGSNDASNGSITGWTQAVSAAYTDTPKDVAIFYKIAGAAEGDVTLVWTGSTSSQLIIEEWTGIDGTPLDKTAFTDNTGAVEEKSSGTTAVTTVDDELCIAAFKHGAAVTDISYDPAYTAEFTADDVHFASLIVSSTGAQETTASWTTARITGGCIATFKATQADGESAIFFGINFWSTL